LLAGVIAICVAVSFAVFYWRTRTFLTAEISAGLSREAQVIVAHIPRRRLQALEDLLSIDARGDRLAGVFSADGRQILGNLESVPVGLSPDASVHEMEMVRVGGEKQAVLAIARRLPRGEVLVLGRSMDQFANVAKIDLGALVLGLLLSLCLAILTGILFSFQARYRLEEVNRRVQRIVSGDLRERLPSSTRNDPFNELALIVNGMLDKIESLVHEIAGFSSDMAHGLRTPLTRVRLSLERGRANAGTLDDLQATVDRAITGLDHSLAIVTALLRLAQIEQSRRLDGFGEVALADLVREVSELYGPIAEDKRISVRVHIRQEAVVMGDRHLLCQALANLMDNAVKYTPEGGEVELTLLSPGDKRECILRIQDTGPGIGIGEGELAIRRFYRSEKSRQRAEGLGLGLSLVAAIVKLHDFRMSIVPGPGCLVEIVCRTHGSPP
jgi:signal transduction histidine kinase